MRSLVVVERDKYGFSYKPSSDGGTRVVGGETLAGWCVISRSPRGRISVTEAHLAFSGARIHSNKTTEMTALMIEAVSFLGPHGSVARDEQSCI